MLDCHGKYLSRQQHKTLFRLNRGIQRELWLNPLGSIFYMYAIHLPTWMVHFDGKISRQKEKTNPTSPESTRHGNHIHLTSNVFLKKKMVGKKLFHHKWHRSCHTPNRSHRSKRCLRQVESRPGCPLKDPTKNGPLSPQGPLKHLKVTRGFGVPNFVLNWVLGFLYDAVMRALLWNHGTQPWNLYGNLP